MNNEIPERIYHDPDIGNFGYEECEGDTVYVREDIVQELVEALEAVVRYHQAANSTEPVDLLALYSDAYDKVKASLAKAKGVE